MMYVHVAGEVRYIYLCYSVGFGDGHPFSSLHL